MTLTSTPRLVAVSRGRAAAVLAVLACRLGLALALLWAGVGFLAGTIRPRAGLPFLRPFVLYSVCRNTDEILSKV
jgi:hypothetical protein